VKRSTWHLAWLALAALIVLVAFFPAALAWRMLAGKVGGLDLGSVHGTVWNGRAINVVISGMPVGTLRWDLSRTALLGRVELAVQVDGPLMQGSVRLARVDEAWLGRDLKGTVDVARLPFSIGPRAWRPQGTWDFTIPRIEIRGGWPVQLDGRVVWRNAALSGRHDIVALGVLRARLSEKAGTIIEARLADAGGPVALSGTLQASPLGWRLHALLRARSSDASLHRLLAALGPMDADGTVHLRRRGGLMMGEEP